MMYKSVDTQLVTDLTPLNSSFGDASSATLPLIRKLCHLLAAKNISYCHWKSNDVLERSASGDNDLDLLVSRVDTSRFSEILSHLGFKQARASLKKQMPGVLDYFGYDEVAKRLIHVHVHYQLILGHDMSKNFRIPIEHLYLESAVQGDLFKIPMPEYEYIVFVIRMVLKHSTWDTILGREGKLKNAERQELAYLLERINPDCVKEIVQGHLPYIGVELFNNCVKALQENYSLLKRARTGHQLQSKLQVHSRRSLLADISLKLWRRTALSFRRRIFKSTPKYRLGSGGTMIAIVGGDGAGKSTAVDALTTWLSEHFATNQVHLGKPAWSWTTKAVRGFLKIGNLIGLYPVESTFQATINEKSVVSPGYPFLLREVCRARDRFNIYWKARRFATNGGLVICDRHTVPQIKIMDGPLVEQFINQLENGPRSDLFLSPHQNSKLAQALLRLEQRYYQLIVPPELLIVLLVEPAIAVQRKTDEDAATVLERSTKIWEGEWEQIDAHVIDAGQSKTAVLAELKSLIWSKL